MGLTPPPPHPAPGERWALFLDLDGTLLDIAATPDGVVVPPGLPALLQDLHTRLDGALAIVSGRPMATIDDLFAPVRFPAAGLHGMERRDGNGRVHRVSVDPHAIDAARRVIARFIVAHPRCLVEDKGATLVLHYRRDPDRRDAARRAMDEALAATGDASLHIQPAHMAFELKSRLADKGSVIRAFLDEPPWRGRTPIFIGDDLTDEHGFTTVRTHAGIAIRVGTPPETTAATHTLPHPPAVHQWLSTLRTTPP